MYNIEKLKLVKNAEEECWELVELLEHPEENGNNANVLVKFYDSNKRSRSPLGLFLLKMLKQLKEIIDNKEE